MIKGLSETGAQRLVAARKERATSPSRLSPPALKTPPPASRLPPPASNGATAPFEDIARCAKLSRHDLECLAAAGALASLAGHRREAFWHVSGIEPMPPVLENTHFDEARVVLTAPTEGEDIVADYATLSLTLGRHPLALLREQFAARRVIPAAALATVPHGRVVTVAGLVLTRQRPASAGGVTFVTLEDETGQANLIVWERTGLAQRRALVESRLMEVRGELQREGQVIHVIAHRMTDRSALLGDLLAPSRDFR
jgi:error-prone DNA polymerase